MTELNHESRKYADHDLVKKADKVCSSIFAALDKLRASNLPAEQIEELSFNMENTRKQVMKLKRMLKPDSAFVTRVDLDEAEDWIDITMSDVVLLKINELTDILERKINRIEKAIKPKPLTREQRMAELKAIRADPFHPLNLGF